MTSDDKGYSRNTFVNLKIYDIPTYIRITSASAVKSSSTTLDHLWYNFIESF